MFVSASLYFSTSEMLIDTISTQTIIDDENQSCIVNNTQNGSLSIRTNKQEYRNGEAIDITVHNKGDNSLVFPDSSLGIQIENLDSGNTFGLPAATVLTVLEPSESRRLELNGRDQDTQLAPGKYRIATTPIGENCSTVLDFTITD
jgi:hypothetical protein